MQNRLKIALVVAVFFGLIAAYGIYNFLRQQREVAETMIKAGGIYSTKSGEGDFKAVKVLVVESGAVHVRLHENRWKERPDTIDPKKLEVAIGFVPLSEKGFLGWEPVLVLEEKVTEDELVGYRLWKEREPPNK